MIKLELVFGVATFALWLFCVVDVIGAPNREVRNLPKIGWLILVLIFPFVGSLAWLIAGRPESSARRSAYERSAPAFPEYDRPGRAAAVDRELDEEFLKQVRARAEEQRKRYEQSRKIEPEPDPRTEPETGDDAQT